jgi:hypothetical protein
MRGNLSLGKNLRAFTPKHLNEPKGTKANAAAPVASDAEATATREQRDRRIPEQILKQGGPAMKTKHPK